MDSNERKSASNCASRSKISRVFAKWEARLRLRTNIVFGLSGFITVTRACARDVDGKVRANTGIGVDKNWPSINAYTALGFKVYIIDFHVVKAFDKHLYERIGLTKEACYQLGSALRLLK